MNIQNILAPAALAGAVALTSAGAYAFAGQQYESQAKISIVQARAIALKTVPGGKITGEELEKERGGSGLRYSFDVKVRRETHEVGVDAKSGRILENSIEGADSD